MHRTGGKVLFSATDLMRFMGCAHATTLDLARLNGTGPKPREDSADAALLQAQGDAHEKAHLSRLISQGCSVVEIARGELSSNVAETRITRLRSTTSAPCTPAAKASRRTMPRR